MFSELLAILLELLSPRRVLFATRAHSGGDQVRRDTHQRNRVQLRTDRVPLSAIGLDRPIRGFRAETVGAETGNLEGRKG